MKGLHMKNRIERTWLRIVRRELRRARRDLRRALRATVRDQRRARVTVEE